jgi:hypothetical protein
MTALVEPADIQQLLGKPADADTELLTVLCDSASAFVLQYLGRESLDIATYTERYNGTGSDTLVPNCRPITGVTSVRINNVDIQPSVNYGNGFFFDKRGIYLYGHKFDRALKNVELVYSAGFAAIPLDIKQACVDLVAEKYQRRTRMGISSKSMGQESITYSANDLAPHAKLALNQYKVRYFTT